MCKPVLNHKPSVSSLMGFPFSQCFTVIAATDCDSHCCDCVSLLVQLLIEFSADSDQPADSYIRMAAVSSPSECLRAEGNQYYLNAKDGSVGNSVRKLRYEKALQLYNQSLNAATTAEERASALKNLAYASWKYV